VKQVCIVCDGCSLGNGLTETRAAAVAILEYNGRYKIIGEYLGSLTNQQAEIMAACIGLEALREPCRVRLISDSQYLIRTMNGEFKRKANHQFWQRLDRASNGHEITWEWTRGHAGHPLQEKCDRAAKKIAAAGASNQSLLNSILNVEPETGLSAAD